MSTRSISRTRPCWGLRTNHTGARVYIALLEWGILMAAIKVGLAIRSDSTVVLALLEKAASSSTALNLLAAEMALRLEKLQIGEIVLLHVPGKINVFCRLVVGVARSHAESAPRNQNRQSTEAQPEPVFAMRSLFA